LENVFIHSRVIVTVRIEGRFRVINTRQTSYRGIIGVELRGEGGVELYLEYPEGVTKVPLARDSVIEISINNEKDPEFRSRWSIYMRGIVYHVGDGIIKVSIGGLIMDIRGYGGEARVGDWVYVGIRLLS